MDPVSVLSVIEASAATLKACTTVTKAVLEFVEDIRNAEEWINKIRQDVKKLERLLKAVKDCFEQIDIQHTDLRMRQQVLGAVNGSITDCDSSLKSLINILGYVRGADARVNIIVNTQQAWRLRSKRQDLEDCRGEIESHKLSLNLSLTLVSL